MEGKKIILSLKNIGLFYKRKTGLLSLRLADEKGMIYFEKGHVFQAMVGEVQAEEASAPRREQDSRVLFKLDVLEMSGLDLILVDDRFQPPVTAMA